MLTVAWQQQKHARPPGAVIWHCMSQADDQEKNSGPLKAAALPAECQARQPAADPFRHVDRNRVAHLLVSGRVGLRFGFASNPAVAVQG